MTVSFPGATEPFGTRSVSDLSQKMSMGWLLPLMIWSVGRSSAAPSGRGIPTLKLRMANGRRSVAGFISSLRVGLLFHAAIIELPIDIPQEILAGDRGMGDIHFHRDVAEFGREDDQHRALQTDERSLGIV
jgi:hypothetical protein